MWIYLSLPDALRKPVLSSCGAVRRSEDRYPRHPSHGALPRLCEPDAMRFDARVHGLPRAI